MFEYMNIIDIIENSQLNAVSYETQHKTWEASMYIGRWISSIGKYGQGTCLKT